MKTSKSISGVSHAQELLKNLKQDSPYWTTVNHGMYGQITLMIRWAGNGLKLGIDIQKPAHNQAIRDSSFETRVKAVWEKETVIRAFSRLWSMAIERANINLERDEVYRLATLAEKKGKKKFISKAEQFEIEKKITSIYTEMTHNDCQAWREWLQKWVA